MSRPGVSAFLAIPSLILVLAGCGGGSPSPSRPPGSQSYQLTVTPPAAGVGTVTSNPQGINCPTTCSATFPSNTTVQLAATPNRSYFFGGWSGGCSGSGSCSVSMTGSETVSATFNPGEELTVSMAGTGTGVVTSSPAGINCPASCSATFPADTQVTLSETPGGNDAFTSWGGGCTGAANCNLTLTASASVTANFAADSGGDGSVAAFVYVSSNTTGNNYEVQAYGADSAGDLTAVAGSPFPANVSSMAGDGKYLFATDGVNIYSFSLAPDGSITQVSSISGNQGNPNSCGSPSNLFVDRAGATLYDLDYVSDCANNQYQSFSIDSATGGLTFVGITTAASPVFEKALSFIGNDQYAYSASCYHYYQEIYGFHRNSDGSLTSITNLGTSPPMPDPPPGDGYCPWLAAADADNHLAVSLTPTNASTFQVAGATQLAVYSVGSSGELTTASTAANMPQVAVGSISDMQTSPAGNYLAVAGTGLQVFNFNAGNISQLTGLVTSTQIDQLAWDHANHLYAISSSTSKLFVFTVSSSGASQAPGSPYNVTTPVNLAVIPWN